MQRNIEDTQQSSLHSNKNRNVYSNVEYTFSKCFLGDFSPDLHLFHIKFCHWKHYYIAEKLITLRTTLRNVALYFVKYTFIRKLFETKDEVRNVMYILFCIIVVYNNVYFEEKTNLYLNIT
jgi:hypothetical protein